MKARVLMAAALLFALSACGETTTTSEPTAEPATTQTAAAVGEMCGGIAGIACGEGLYCNYEGGTCGAADQSGTCQARGEICTREYVPVCGCDGVTYPNACQAAVAGVSVASQGECPAQPAATP